MPVSVCLPSATCHGEKCFVLIPFTGLASHKKRGFCLAEKRFWTYLARDFSFQIWSSRAQFERLSDLSPNVCRRWLISYFLEKQTVRVVNFTLSYLWICFVTQFWLLSKWVLSRISDFTTRRCRWLLTGARGMEGLAWTRLVCCYQADQEIEGLSHSSLSCQPLILTSRLWTRPGRLAVSTQTDGMTSISK